MTDEELIEVVANVERALRMLAYTSAGESGNISTFCALRAAELQVAIEAMRKNEGRLIDYTQLRKDIYADLFDAMRTTDYVGTLDDRCNRLTDRIMLYVKGQIALAAPDQVLTPR